MNEKEVQSSKIKAQKKLQRGKMMKDQRREIGLMGRMGRMGRKAGADLLAPDR